jgi:hypothetical protein
VGFTYDRALTASEYSTSPGMAKRVALLRAVVLDDAVSLREFEALSDRDTSGFTGLLLPPGTHGVELTCAAPYCRISAAISALALCLISWPAYRDCDTSSRWRPRVVCYTRPALPERRAEFDCS